MSHALRRLGPPLRAAARALRGFLAGFTGMPSPRLAERCPDGARRALEGRSSRRPSCC